MDPKILLLCFKSFIKDHYRNSKSFTLLLYRLCFSDMKKKVRAGLERSQLLSLGVLPNLGYPETEEKRKSLFHTLGSLKFLTRPRNCQGGSIETHLNAVSTSDAQTNHSSKVIGGHHFLFTDEEKLGQFKNSCITIVLKAFTKTSKSLGNKTASYIPTHFRKAQPTKSTALC